MIQRLRVPLGFLVAAAVLYLATPNGPSILLGFPIALTGAAFRGMAAGVIRKDSQLATSGAYAWTRNPLYFGSSLLALGFAIMSWNLRAAALLLVPFALIYSSVIRSEETHLERLFPAEFAIYRSQVPRFLPRVRMMDRSFSLTQYLANREYNTAIGLAAASLFFLLKWLRG